MTDKPSTRLRRRTLLLGGAGAVILGGGSVGGWMAYRTRHADPPQLSATVAFSSRTTRQLVPSTQASSVLPRTRILRGATDLASITTRQDAWLGHCSDWLDRIPHGMRDLAASALLDLWVLSDGLPASVASWSPHWRYIWPRDASFVAVALARTGLVSVAQKHLQHLARLQHDNGWFEARYIPGTARPPDNRQRQLDGTAWVLWASREIADASSHPTAFLQSVTPMLARSTHLLLDLTHDGAHLPPPSPDYWEVPETRTTLGTAAAVQVGLDNAPHLAPLLSSTVDRERVSRAVRTYSRTLATTFQVHGYQRYESSGGSDSAVTFLQKPYVSPPAILATPGQITHERKHMTRPAGGVAPGQSWKNDGISWTPETSLFAAAAAGTGHTDRASALLEWLGNHRTNAHSYPEKSPLRRASGVRRTNILDRGQRPDHPGHPDPIAAGTPSYGTRHQAPAAQIPASALLRRLLRDGRHHPP